MQQEYKPFDRVEVYREIMETIKKGTFCQQRFIIIGKTKSTAFQNEMYKKRCRLSSVLVLLERHLFLYDFG